MDACKTATDSQICTPCCRRVSTPYHMSLCAVLGHFSKILAYGYHASHVPAPEGRAEPWSQPAIQFVTGLKKGGLTIRLMTMVVLHLQVLKVSRMAALATSATPTAPKPAHTLAQPWGAQ